MAGRTREKLNYTISIIQPCPVTCPITLKHMVQPSKVVPCCSTVQMPVRNQYWVEKRAAQMKEQGRKDDQCTRNATIRINGKPYCMLHAGPRAVEILLRLKGVIK